MGDAVVRALVRQLDRAFERIRPTLDGLAEFITASDTKPLLWGRAGNITREQERGSSLHRLLLVVQCRRLERRGLRSRIPSQAASKRRRQSVEVRRRQPNVSVGRLG